MHKLSKFEINFVPGMVTWKIAYDGKLYGEVIKSSEAPGPLSQSDIVTMCLENAERTIEALALKKQVDALEKRVEAELNG